jgi:hypothetical protein
MARRSRLTGDKLPEGDLRPEFFSLMTTTSRGIRSARS